MDARICCDPRIGATEISAIFAVELRQDKSAVTRVIGLKGARPEAMMGGDESKPPSDLQAKRVALEAMRKAVNQDPTSEFLVQVSQYSIRDALYLGGALTIAAGDDPNLSLREDGFDCDARFPVEMLRPDLYDVRDVEDGVARVRVSVRADDISAIFRIHRDGKDCSETMFWAG